ncbi:MAG: hypothetical protein JSR89_18310 [Proteobacteria bacterium]|nr:hypothetical protein [Pseudomonadota bacterium]
MSGIYTVGLRLVAHNDAGGVLLNLASQLLHVHSLTNQTNMALGRFRTALAGMAGIWAGTEMIKSAAHLVEHGVEFQHIQNQMAISGWKQAEAAEAVAKAWELTAKYQTIGPEHQLKMLQEMAPVLGSPEHALEMADKVAAMVANLQSVVGDKAESVVDKAIKDAVVGGELSGNALDMERFSKYIDGMVRTLNAFGGTITPSDYMMTFKYGRAAGLSWSDDFINYYLPTLMQMTGGSSAGNALMGLTQALIGGHITKSSWAEWDRLGLVDVAAIEKKWGNDTWTPEGKLKHWDAHALKNYQLFQENPLLYAQQELVPAMMKAGLITPSGWAEVQKGNIKEGIGRTTRQAVVEELYGLLSNRVSQGALDNLTLDIAKFDKDAAWLHRGDWAFGGRMGHHWLHRRNAEGNARTMLERDYQTNLSAFTTQWNALLTAVGSPAMGLATQGLHMMVQALSGLTQLVAHHPALGTGLVAGLSVGGAAAAIGIAMRLAAVFIPGGALIVGLTTLGSTVASLAAAHWDEIKKFGPKAMGAVTGAFSDLGTWISQAITNIPSKANDAIWKMGNALGQAIHDAIANAASGIFGGSVTSGPTGARGTAGVAPGGPGLMHRQSWVPPSGGGGMQPIHTAVIMDGRKIAEQVTYHQVRGARFVGGAATFDAVAHPSPVDQSYT